MATSADMSLVEVDFSVVASMPVKMWLDFITPGTVITQLNFFGRGRRALCSEAWEPS